jgi:hypothetical protein
MEALIGDSNTDARMSGLERFLECYLGPRRPEFGASEDELRSIEMPAPLQQIPRPRRHPRADADAVARGVSADRPNRRE